MDDGLTPRDDRTTRRLGGLVLLREDVASELTARLRGLIDAGHPLVLDSQNGRGRPPSGDGESDGLRLYGDGGLFTARTVLAVIQLAIRDSCGAFYVDLRGLDYLALATWAVILRGTQEFRSQGGLLRVDAGERYKRMLETTTIVESDHTNVELV